ncbi:cytidine and dCMP deaminase domain-containing protein 1-like isoform X2 [Conger conger]|uniref:cytidine and dCMP deaminase domain-containing protein 1-like isoform X2 n=1 Tax=Conger conger TaxID=82655 RepID=UPI002A59F3BE|nr:cytidine and dCMP deaminase domain-containing protein 1-like isoform X2 [Conger conger]
MATAKASQDKKNQDESRNVGPQTDSKGHEVRLSRVNLFTLLSLWMELFPRTESQTENAEQSTGRKCTKQDGKNIQAKVSGLVVVQGRKVIGLHCSSAELHVGQVAVIRHGPRLKGCDLYFSRKPCSTCMKMIVNADVNRVSYWPGDPELSFLPLSDAAVVEHPAAVEHPAEFDAIAAERLRSHRQLPVYVPLPHMMLRFAADTSAASSFLEYVAHSESRDARELFIELQQRSLEDLTATFFVTDELRHKYILRKIGLESFCEEPYFSNLRKHMQDLIKVLASVASSVPDLQPDYGFYVNDQEEDPVPDQVEGPVPDQGEGPVPDQVEGPVPDQADDPAPGLSQDLPQDLSQDLPQDLSQDLPQDLSQDHSLELPPNLSQGLPQDVARHCMIQAQLLAYRTEDPKIGVGAVSWADGKSDRCDGTGHMYLVGCGYNGYPGGSAYSAFPWMGSDELNPRKKKYKYIIHAEQNVLIFRSAEIKEDEKTMLFVTKCPCDDCVPLIVGAGIKQVYTTDRDSGKDKGDLSYLKFVQQQDVQKFIWQKTPQAEDLP